jgi:hypothetical protein
MVGLTRQNVDLPRQNVDLPRQTFSKIVCPTLLFYICKCSNKVFTAACSPASPLSNELLNGWE